MGINITGVDMIEERLKWLMFLYLFFNIYSLAGVDMIEERLKFICTEENVNIAPDACKALIDICEGDLRKAITTLQSVARLGAGEQVTSEQVQEITGV